MQPCRQVRTPTPAIQIASFCLHQRLPLKITPRLKRSSASSSPDGPAPTTEGAKEEASRFAHTRRMHCLSANLVMLESIPSIKTTVCALRLTSAFTSHLVIPLFFLESKSDAFHNWVPRPLQRSFGLIHSCRAVANNPCNGSRVSI